MSAIAERYAEFRSTLELEPRLTIDDMASAHARGDRQRKIRCAKRKKGGDGYTRTQNLFGFRDTRLDPLTFKPGFTTYYDLGVRISKQLHSISPLPAVAAAIGLTKQNTYTVMVVALGKVAYHVFHESGGRKG